MEDYNEKEAQAELLQVECAEAEALKEDAEEAQETGINYTFNI